MPNLPKAHDPGDPPTNPRTLKGMVVSEFRGESVNQSDLLRRIADFLDEDTTRFIEVVSFNYDWEDNVVVAIVAHTERSLEEQLQEPFPRKR